MGTKSYNNVASLTYIFLSCINSIYTSIYVYYMRNLSSRNSYKRESSHKMAKKITNNSPLPKYQQISHWMRENILSGSWSENEQLPSETKLADELNVSRGTIRKAIEELIGEGLLVRTHGKGTFVKTNLLLEQKPTWRIAGFSRDLISRGIPYSTKVLLKEIISPPQEIANKLSLPPEEKIFHMQRLRLVHEEPVLLIENHIDYQRCQGIENIDFSEKQLYKTLENQCSFNFDWARRSYRAQVADERISECLEVDVGFPIMYLEELYHLEGDIPAEFTKAWINGEYFHISTRINREDEKQDRPGIYR